MPQCRNLRAQKLVSHRAPTAPMLQRWTSRKSCPPAGPMSSEHRSNSLMQGPFPAWGPWRQAVHDPAVMPQSARHWSGKPLPNPGPLASMSADASTCSRRAGSGQPCVEETREPTVSLEPPAWFFLSSDRFLFSNDRSFLSNDIFHWISHDFGERDRTCRCFYLHFDFKG